MIEIASSRLPSEYQEVEYIRSSGTQYIDTGFKPNQNTRVVCKGICPVDGSADWMFGARHSWSSQAFGFVGADAGVYYSFFNTGSVQFDASYNSSDVIEVDCNKGVTTLTANGQTGTLTGALGTFSCSYNLVLFAGNTQNSITYGVITIYSCQIYDNDTLIRDFVPCYRKADTVAGLYDIVNGVFYANAGTGTFTKGADVGRGSIVVTEGGIIPKKWALRRRMLVMELSKTAKVTLSGEFYYNSGAYASVEIDGNTYNSAQTIEVLAGTVITVRNYKNSYWAQCPITIILNGVVVATQTNATSTITYTHVVNTDCNIEAYTIYQDSMMGRYIGIRITG